ncbi:MAG TPA: hypothetical protein DDW81_14140, partial [Cryomorphaceae bacterium]|nr:hypothetical protein [Cryomorphaceae bacterium]
MRNFASILLILTGISLSLYGQDSHALFIKNDGQWSSDFNYRLRLNSGDVFFEDNGYTISLHNADDFHHHHDEPGPKSKQEELLKRHVVKVKFLYANPFPQIQGAAKRSFYHNYLLGNDPSQWRASVPVYQQLNYLDLYPGVNVRFRGKGGNLKYDFHLAPHADPRLLQMQYQGADMLSINKGHLLIQTSLGTLQEFIPEAYQVIKGQKINIPCSYTLVNHIVKFKLGPYNPEHELIIDPELVFSSFSGSSIDNWGFTATFDHEGNLYAGGITFGLGYPTSPGAYQEIYKGGDVDMSISKFSALGDTLLYSTYVGGTDNDVPHSLVVDDDNQLFILGNTGSSNYPVSGQALQANFNGGPPLALRFMRFNHGSDIVVTKLSADGTKVMASTFLGGTENDGLNTGIFQNYGDNCRGEIIYADNKVYLISNTRSNHIPLPNALNDSIQGDQDALVVCLQNDLSSIVWGTYFGGLGDDAGYSIKPDQGNKVVIGGATRSNDIDISPQAHTPNAQGSIDGYLAVFNRLNGNLTASTYVGTSDQDQAFLIDIDKFNNLYVLGQTEGQMTMSAGIYGTPNSRQFIKKFDMNLATEIWSTTIGSGQAKDDLVPTAFLVDECFNIYLSGWNGQSNVLTNGGPPQGNTLNLPLTSDALQSSTDGSDFYFMVLERDAKSLAYATYFGGTSNEHVDGGTSRFDPHGTIYQAVCAGCSLESFPVTPGVVSETNNSNNCNLGAIKLDFEATVRAKPEIDFMNDTDTICDTLFVQLSNKSINAQVFEWDFGNGLTSSEEEPTTFYDNFGTYTIRLIATDTICDIADTNFIEVVHDTGIFLESGFTSEYIGCDSEFRALFTNTSTGSQAYQWDFGDGDFSQETEPEHLFQDTGLYIVSLTAINVKCNKSETFVDTLVFQDTSSIPDPLVEVSLCGDGSVDIALDNDRRRYRYSWDFGNGVTEEKRYPSYRYQEPGVYTVSVDINDTV